MDQKILKELLVNFEAYLLDIRLHPAQVNNDIPWGQIIHDPRLAPILEIVLNQINLNSDSRLNIKKEDCSIALGIIEKHSQHTAYRRAVKDEEMVDKEYTRIYIPISGPMLFSINNENKVVETKEFLLLRNHVDCNFLPLNDRDTSFLIIDFPPFKMEYDISRSIKSE